MGSSPRVATAALSFLIPGAGQLIGRRLVRAGAFFSFFIVLLSFRVGVYGLAFVCAGSAWDAYRQPPQERFSGYPRVVWLAVSLITFILWMSLVTSRLVPIANTLARVEQADWIAEELRRCRLQLKQIPLQMTQCTGLLLQPGRMEGVVYRAESDAFTLSTSLPPEWSFRYRW